MKILAFGEVMMRMMPSNYKTLIQADTLEFLFTGTGMNILSGLYQMGDQGYLITRLPDNSVGKAASAHMRKLGIHDDYVAYGDNHIGIYFLEQGFGNRASEVTYLNRKDSSFGLSQLSDYNFDCLNDMDALHICGISLALNERLRKIALTFAKEAKKRNVKVIFDCNFRPSLWTHSSKNQIKEIYEEMFYMADIVFAGIKDAKLLLQKEVDESLSFDQQLSHIFQSICKEYHIDAVFGTIRDIQSSQQYLSGYMIQKDSFMRSKKYQLTVFDRVGGGDGFAAGAIHGYFHHMEHHKLIEYATCSGVLAHTTYGDSPILHKDAIIDFMKYGKTDIKR